MKIQNGKLSVRIVLIALGLSLMWLGSVGINNSDTLATINKLVFTLVTTLSICGIGIGAILLTTGILSFFKFKNTCAN